MTIDATIEALERRYPQSETAHVHVSEAIRFLVEYQTRGGVRNLHHAARHVAAAS